jgi:Skp family chaperone for outer membrane proteins
MAGHGPNARNLDPGIRVVLEELRDLRVEMRADRQRANEERRKADEERRQERLRSDERFEKVIRETQRAFKDVRSVGGCSTAQSRRNC